MIAIQYVYNRSKKTLARPPNEMNFEQMEKDVKRLFHFGDRPLLFCYFDEENLKMLILDEDDFQDVFKLASNRIEPTKIYVNMREKVIAEMNDIELIQKCFIKEFLHRQQKYETFHKKRLITDLHSLRESFKKVQMKPHLINKTITFISKEVQLFYAEKSFCDSMNNHLSDLDEEKNSQGFSPKKDKLCNELSFSSIKDKQTISSFFSSKHDKIPFENRNFKKNSPRFELIEENNLEEVFCRSCNAEISNEIRFECHKCKNFQLCDDCVSNSRHKHELRPLFIINDSKQKINALHRTFKRLKYNRAGMLFEIWNGRVKE